MNTLQNHVYQTLKELNSLDRLTELFCSHLNYHYSGSVLSKRDWKEEVAVSAQNLQFVATHDDFNIIFCEIERLLLGIERPIINQILRQYPYTLIVFSDSSYQNWHLVNIRYDEEVRNRRLFRRIAVGPDERLHTAAQRINLLDVKDESMTALDLQKKHDEAFDVEEVTKEFFNTFVDIFHLLRKELAENNPTYAAKADEEAQILLDRLMFLYFIQKKGWLDGRKDFLYQKFLEVEKKGGNDSTFYQQTLLPLFQALSNPDPGYRKHLGDIPFLNGGLFEVSPFYSKLPYSLKIPNTVFKSIFNDLLERFNFTVREDTPLDVEVAIDPEMLGRVFENLILQLEKDKDLRKITGSYYTPRVVVHFMCQQSLKEYLFSEWIRGFRPRSVEPGKLPFKSTSPQRELSDIMLEKQKEDHRKKIEFLYTLNPADQLSEEEINQLHAQITINDVRVLRELIRKAYILDPAVGSGAFLVGMLHEMISMTKLLDLREFGSEKIAQPNDAYELKREIIENCLYGVDIQEQSVRICELRLWLSLVVDYERGIGEDVPPLPNLSYKVRCGDSLIEKLFGHNVQLDQLVRANRGRQLIDEIREDKEAYFLTRDIEEKKKKELAILYKQCELAEMLIKEKRSWLKNFGGVQSGVFGETAKEQQQREEKRKELEEYDRILYQAENIKKKVQAMLQRKVTAFLDDIHRLRQSLGLSFIWKLDFAEVFKEKEGFDIVIANPPYLNTLEIEKAKPYLSKIYETPFGSYDIYIVFIEKGINLLHSNGILSYITSNKYFIADYGKKLRNLLVAKNELLRLVDLADCKRVFQHALVSPAILFVRSHQERTTVPESREIQLQVLKETELEKITTIIPEIRLLKDLVEGKNKIFRIYFDNATKKIEEKLLEKSVKLKQIADVRTGVMGFDYWSLEPFIYDYKKNDRKRDCRIATNSYVDRFQFLWGKKVKIYGKTFYQPYIDLGGEAINYNTQELFHSKKIVIRGVAKRLTAAVDTEGVGILVAVHSVIPHNLSMYYLAALLNSNLFNWLHIKRFYSARIPEGSLRYPISFLTDLPIYSVDLSNDSDKRHYDTLVSLAQEIAKLLENHSASIPPEIKTKIEKALCKINSTVYSLYELKDIDIAQIEKDLKW